MIPRKSDCILKLDSPLNRIQLQSSPVQATYVWLPQKTSSILYVRIVISEWYRDDVLQFNVRVLRDVAVVDIAFECEVFYRMDWPERSPDLNPIDNVWDALQRTLA